MVEVSQRWLEKQGVAVPFRPRSGRGGKAQKGGKS